MNAGVALVQAYLHLNGYFTAVDFPVIRGSGPGQFREVTDVDVLAVRFPGAASVVPQGDPGPEDDLRFHTDDRLDLPTDAMDVLIGEVKEGKARLNDALRTPEVLRTVLLRVGCCPLERIDEVAEALRTRGVAHLPPAQVRIPCRIRLVAFGGGGEASGYTVVHLAHAASFVRDYLTRYHHVLHPADIGDPVLGLLHLLEKLT